MKKISRKKQIVLNIYLLVTVTLSLLCSLAISFC